MWSNDCDVLIVGAGPTGLTLACVLTQWGIRCRLIDLSATPPTGSRGKGLQPRSLELLDDLGIVERVIAHGVFDMPICHYDQAGQPKIDPQPRPAPRTDAPYLAPLITPQWRVEEALRARLVSLGGQVEFGMPLVAIEQHDEGVTAHLEPTAGQRSIRANWLVGCDGGKSQVRHLSNIAFIGETIETYRMLLADVQATGLDRDHWHIWRASTGFFGMCPLPSTLSFQLQASLGPEQDAALTLASCQQLLEERSHRQDVRLTEASWLSLWRANVRMVERYRVGRVFLAGDAAHVHSPAGGQGMNTGIQDACNLGWKLAAVVRGVDAALLDSYEAERLPVAAAVLGLSNELMAATVASGTMAFRRDETTLQLSLNYRQSNLSKDLRDDKPTSVQAGDRAADAPGLLGPNGACRVFDLLRGPHWTLLGVGSQWQAVIDACVGRFGRAVKGYALVSGASDPGCYVDAQGHARATYGDDALFVVRPDNYIGMVTRGRDPAALFDYLRGVCAPR
jgi:2-polyprenyl-6-methoxyphenol hydroxylase-like FAD-dependent oxidoreductase